MKATAIYVPETPEDASRFFRGISELKAAGSDVSVSFAGQDDSGLEKYFGAGGAEELLKMATGYSGREMFRATVSYERFSDLREVSKPDLLSVAGGGTTLGELKMAAGDQGMFLPFDQDIFDEDTTVAELVNGGAVSRWEGRYGALRESILSVGIVTPSGDMIHSGSRSVKDVAGYEVTGFVLGSGGRCGMIHSVTFRLLPRPGDVRYITCTGDDAVLEAVADRIFRKAAPASIEIYHGAAELMAGVGTGGKPLLLSEIHLPASGGETLEGPIAEILSGDDVSSLHGFSGDEAKKSFTSKVREHFGGARLLASLVVDLKPQEIPGKAPSNTGEDHLSWTGYFPMRGHFVWEVDERDRQYHLPRGIEDAIAGNLAPGARVRFELINIENGCFRRMRLPLESMSCSNPDLFREVTDGEVISEISEKIYRLFDPERIVLVG